MPHHDEFVIRVRVEGPGTGGQIPDVAHNLYFVKKLIEGAVKREQLPASLRVVDYEIRNAEEMVPAWSRLAPDHPSVGARRAAPPTALPGDADPAVSAASGLAVVQISRIERGVREIRSARCCGSSRPWRGRPVNF